ncbi:hypothetical protein [Magnetovibrio sp.]|uniref:hypothetical protein n=1 Tax=Magnetovibrio sp. TaxID=2024836 RepID=UPI002F92E694
MGVLELFLAAPSLINAGRKIYNSVTGENVGDDVTPQDLSARIDDLPADQRDEITKQLIAASLQKQVLDTQRFVALADGDAEKQRATARPEIARRAMGVIEVFATTFKWLMIITIAEWALRLMVAAAGKPFPDVSLWALVAQASPVTEMIWGPLIASFWVCASIVKTYFGVRAADKAQQFEIQAGRPLESHVATVAAAGSGLADLIKAIRGK